MNPTALHTSAARLAVVNSIAVAIIADQLVAQRVRSVETAQPATVSAVDASTSLIGAVPAQA